MRICLLGYGGMGQSTSRAATERGHQIACIIDNKNPLLAQYSEINSETFANSEVVIDFTQPDAVIANLKELLPFGKPIVIGTTGWYEKLDEVKDLVQAHSGTALWSSNFSIGVNLYFKIVEAASKLVDKYSEYDVWATELHHNRKADSPSGTAKTLEEILLANIERKTAVVEGKLDRVIQPHELHFSSTRGGAVNFSHTIGFDSAADTISMTHSARNRDGYAVGAIQAAEWLIQQKAGLYSMNDFLGF